MGCARCARTGASGSPVEAGVVGNDEAVQAVGGALSEHETGDRTDVVDDERETVEPAGVDEVREEVRVPGQRVVEPLGLGAAAEAWRSGAIPPVRSRNGSQIHEPTGFPCR